MDDRELQRQLDALAHVSAETPPDPGALLALLAADDRRRASRLRLALLPALLVLAAGVGYAAARWGRVIPTDIELRVDGGERRHAGTFELVVDEEGRPRPIQVPVAGRGTVEVEVELPEGVDPRTVAGLRFLVEVSTDPDPESDE